MTTNWKLNCPVSECKTKVSKYDRANGWLVTAILIVGSFVAIVGLVLFNPGSNLQSRAVPLDWRIANPDQSSVRELHEYADVDDFDSADASQFAEMVESASSVVTQVGFNDAQLYTSPTVGKGRTGNWSNLRNSGKGNFVPFYRRLRINYDAVTRETYARQLSFFQIKLGAVQQITNGIVLLADPGGVAKVEQSNRQAEAKSVHFGHTSPLLQRWDREILTAAKVDSTDCLIRQFYSPATVSKLVALEKQYLEDCGRQLQDVQRTYFTVVPNGTGFEFKLTGQTYRQ